MFLSVKRCAEHMTRLRKHKINVTFQGHGIYPINFVSADPFEQFSLYFTQMFLSVSRCEEQMTRLGRLKVTFQSRSWDVSFNFVSAPYLPEPFERFSLNLTQMCLSAVCRTHDLTMQAQGHTSRSWDLPFNFISPEPFEQYSLNFTQMFRSVRWCSEPMTQCMCTSRSHFKVMEFPVNFTSTLFLLNPLRWCAKPMTQLRRIKVKVTLQGHGIM